MQDRDCRVPRWWMLCLVAWAFVVWGDQQTFGAPLSLQSSVSTSFSYDDNIYLSRTSPVGDLATTLSPRVDLVFDQQAIQGSLRYQATGEWYQQRRTENRLSHQAEADVSLKALQRLTRGGDVRVTGSYSRAGQLPGTSLGDTPIEPGGEVLLPRMETTQGRGGVTGAYAWTRRLESRLAYTFTSTTYDSRDARDSVTHDATVPLRYRLSRSTTITLSPGWSAIRVDPAAGAPAADTRVTTRLSAGAEYAAGSTWTSRGQVGVTIVEDDQRRLVLDGDLQRRVKQGQVAFSGGQEIGAGGGVTETASLVQRLGMNVSQALGAKTQMSLRLDYSRNVSLPTGSSVSPTRIQTYTASLGAGYQLLRWLTGRVGYSYLVQDSIGIAVDGKRHVVTVAFTANVPVWSLDR